VEESTYKKIQNYLDILEKVFSFLGFLLLLTHFLFAKIPAFEIIYCIFIAAIIFYHPFQLLVYFYNKDKFDIFIAPKFHHQFPFSILLFSIIVIVPYYIIQFLSPGVIPGFLILGTGLIVFIIIKRLFFSSAKISFLIIDKSRLIVYNKDGLIILDTIIYEGLLRRNGNSLIIDELGKEINLNHFSFETKKEISNYIEELKNISLPPKHMKYIKA